MDMQSNFCVGIQSNFTALNKVTEFGKCLKKFQQGLQGFLLCRIGKTPYPYNISGYVRKAFALDG